MVVVVVVVVTITKVNSHTRVDTEDAEHVGDVVVQIDVCDLMNMEIHLMELIGWRISSMNQVFMRSFWHNRRLDSINYEITEAPPPLQAKIYPQRNHGY